MLRLSHCIWSVPWCWARRLLVEGVQRLGRPKGSACRPRDLLVGETSCRTREIHFIRSFLPGKSHVRPRSARPPVDVAAHDGSVGAAAFVCPPGARAGLRPIDQREAAMTDLRLVLLALVLDRLGVVLARWAHLRRCSQS